MLNLKSVTVLALLISCSPIVKADSWDEMNAQRRNLGLPPLIQDEELMRCAQWKAEFMAAHHVKMIQGRPSTAYLGHLGPSMGPGYIEGCGAVTREWGWNSCAMRTLGQHRAGTGLAIGSDGLRYMCLLIRGRKLPETTIRVNLVDTSYMTPNPPVMAYQGKVHPGSQFKSLQWYALGERPLPKLRILNRPTQTPPQPRSRLFNRLRRR